MWASIKPARPYIPSETKAGFNCIHTSESPHTDSCKVFEPYIQLWRESCLRFFLLFFEIFTRKKNQEFHFTSFDTLRASFWLTLWLHGYQICFVWEDFFHIFWPFLKLFGDFTTKLSIACCCWRWNHPCCSFLGFWALKFRTNIKVLYSKPSN